MRRLVQARDCRSFGVEGWTPWKRIINIIDLETLLLTSFHLKEHYFSYTTDY